MKKIKYLLFFFIILLSSNVYAAEYNMNSHSSATLGGTKNRYRATEIYNTGTANTYTFGTRYNGKISTIETYFEYPFEENTTYTLTYNMNTEDFRNNFGGTYWWDCSEDMNATNQHVGSFSYISYKKVKFTFKPTENTTCIRVLLGSTNTSSTAITGISNWRLDSITIYDPAWQSGSGSGQGSTVAPTPSPNSNQDIINNQNNNTEDIINNNNENTEKIIDNQNSLLGNNCSNLFNQSSLQLGDISGSFTSIRISSSQNLFLSSGDYTFSTNLSSNFQYNLLISDVAPPTLNPIWIYNSGWISSPTKTFSFSNNGYFVIYIRKADNSNISLSDISSFNFMLVSGSSSKPYCEFGSYSSKLDDTTNAINNVNDSINNDNVDNGTGSDFFNNFDDEDFGLSSIITIPLNTIQSLTSKSCVALNVPIPFTNSSVPLPCMTQIYEQNVPTIYNLWKIVSFGIIAYFIAIDIFHMVKGFKDPESDKVEVLDL